MNDNDIKLPERPEPDGFITDGPFDKPVVINVYRDSTLEAYAREAVRMNASQAENVDQVLALLEERDALLAERDRLKEALTAMLEIHGVTQRYADAHIEIPQSWVDVSDLARAALAQEQENKA